MTMSPVYYLGISFTLIILLTITTVLFLSWRKRQGMHAGLARLLDIINEQQTERQKILGQTLSQKLDITDADAANLSLQLVGAEKKFLQHYVLQISQQAPSSALYIELCELLDVYIATLVRPSSDQKNARSEADSASNQQAHQTAIESNQTLPEPDWGDVFD
jgi:hypothetical protein